MDARYERNFPALSEAEFAALRTKRVLVVGCGGLGGYLIEFMTRIGIGTLRICDGDVFEASNLNRQLLSQVPLVGTGKVRAAAERAAAVNPEVHMEVCESFMTPETVVELVQACDAVLDGLDNIESRKLLASACSEAGIPYIYGAVSGWVAQAAISMPGDGLLDRLYPENAKLKSKSVLSFTPALCAAMQTALCVKLLTGRPVESGTMSYFDLLNLEFEIIPV